MNGIFFFGTNTIVATTLNEDAYELTLDTNTICENVSFEENIIASDNDMLYDIAMDNPFQEKDIAMNMVTMLLMKC
jgi:hypothetical protein